MKWPILLACAACVMPATAHAQRVDETIGSWNLTGSGGDCMIATGSAAGMVAIASPATGGENNGGVLITKADLTISQQGDNATLTFSGGGAWPGLHALTPVSDISAYWISFPAQRTIDAFPDRWRMTVQRDGGTILDISVSGFKEARAALWRCVAKTK